MHKFVPLAFLHFTLLMFFYLIINRDINGQAICHYYYGIHFSVMNCTEFLRYTPLQYKVFRDFRNA